MKQRLAAFCQAMKQADPSIELMSSYPTPGVLDRAGEWLNYVSPHHYECANLAAEEGGPECGAQADRRAREGPADHAPRSPSGTRPPATGAPAAASSGAWQMPWLARATTT